MSDEKSRRLFLHTKETSISPAVRRQLLEAGYLPIEVASLGDVRILEPGWSVHLDAGTLDLAGAAALAIVKGDATSTRANFASLFIDGLLKRRARGLAENAPPSTE